jgi:hypothetical protein
LKPRRPQGRDLLGAPLSLLASSSVGRALRCYRSRHRFESCLASHSSLLGVIPERWPSGSRHRFAKPTRRRSSHVGSNPTLSTNTRTHSSAGERRSYKAEVLGSIPSACTIHAMLAQMEQSAGLRSRRSKVRVLHVAPHDSLSSSGWTRTPPFQVVNTSSNLVGPALWVKRFSMVALAQSVRAPSCALGGCGFDPHTSPQLLSTALVAKRLKAPDCKPGERMLHVSSNLTECSRSSSGSFSM